MYWETTIHLQRNFFSEVEKTLAEHEEITASTFLYSTGVHALRLKNQHGELILLPFQGQQIWHTQFFNRPLTMRSMFTQPYPTTNYLRTYGGFLLHCGATAMGVPTSKDTHPLHGELPNAPYQTAQLIIGQDKQGAYMALTGSYQHTVAFSYNYIATPVIKLYAQATTMSISMIIDNLKQSAMDLMYLAHVNFRPIDHGQLIYSAPCTPEQVRVRSSIPAHISPPDGYRDFLTQLEANPAQHNILKPDMAFDPEVVFYINYKTDEAGWAYSMQQHPDGSADLISHRPNQLNHGVRWISRTADQDALGLLLPATAQPEGYTAEKAKGNLKTIPAGGQFHCQMEVGALSPDKAKAMSSKISQILADN